MLFFSVAGKMMSLFGICIPTAAIVPMLIGSIKQLTLFTHNWITANTNTHFPFVFIFDSISICRLWLFLICTLYFDSDESSAFFFLFVSLFPHIYLLRASVSFDRICHSYVLVCVRLWKNVNIPRLCCTPFGASLAQVSEHSMCAIRSRIFENDEKKASTSLDRYICSTTARRTMCHHFRVRRQTTNIIIILIQWKRKNKTKIRRIRKIKWKKNKI